MSTPPYYDYDDDFQGFDGNLFGQRGRSGSLSRFVGDEFLKIGSPANFKKVGEDPEWGQLFDLDYMYLDSVQMPEESPSPKTPLSPKKQQQQQQTRMLSKSNFKRSGSQTTNNQIKIAPKDAICSKCKINNHWDNNVNNVCLLAHPVKMNSYWSCHNGVRILMHCAEELIFDDKLLSCNYPDKVLERQILDSGIGEVLERIEEEDKEKETSTQ